MDVKNKRVVVTGAASGIGKALCEAFHQAEAKTVIAVDINLEGAQDTADSVNGIAVQANVGNEEEIINLASEEYSKALQINKFSNPVITPVSKDLKNGKLKVISFFAKRARGEMVNFIIKNKIKNSENLKSFSNLGYQFTEGTKKGEFLFTR